MTTAKPPSSVARRRTLLCATAQVCSPPGWRRLSPPPVPLAQDSALPLRLSLDPTGQQPDTDQIRKFVADTDPDKRLKLIDQLMASPDFVRFWEIKFGDMLQINVNRVR